MVFARLDVDGSLVNQSDSDKLVGIRVRGGCELHGWWCVGWENNWVILRVDHCIVKAVLDTIWWGFYT